ncbi:MAG: hypothetical protein AAGI72_24715 [Pseudomonadota bacterium]
MQRLGYNASLQVSEAEELLLNLVRLRYQDTPEFLAVSAISSQLSFRATAGVGGDFGNVEEATSAFVAPNITGELSESPTVTLVPRRDEKFSRQLISPIPIDSITLLAFNSWGIDRLMLMFAETINGLDGRDSFAPGAVGTDASEFLALLDSLKTGEERGAISFTLERRRRLIVEIELEAASAIKTLAAARSSGFAFRAGDDTVSLFDERAVIVLQLSDEFLRTRAYEELASVLRLKPGERTVDITRGPMPEGPGDGRIYIVPRSPAGVLAVLATAVEAPGEHLSAFGLAPNAASSSPVRRLLHVRAATERPPEAWLTVPYRGYYFYLANDDVSSRQTLSVAGAFMNLSLSRGDTSAVPVVTLPVGR